MRFTRRQAGGLLAASLSLAGTRLPAEAMYIDGQGLAMRGYDPTTYWTENEPRKGDYEIESNWNGGIWRFVNERTRDKFMASPQQFAPQFGGFCADGIARGFKRSSAWDVFVIVEEKLYMHYSVADQNRWAEDVPGNIELALDQWPTLQAF